MKSMPKKFKTSTSSILLIGVSVLYNIVRLCTQVHASPQVI